jgi:hypothetical protein
MSRVCTIWPVVALLALVAALLATCGHTPAAVSGPPPTLVPPSPTPSPGAELVTREPSATPPPIKTATEVPSTAEPPVESATEQPSPTTLPAELPSETPSPAPTPPLPSPTPAPQILSFTASPTITQNVGDAVHLTWEASGQRAELCHLIGTGPTNCQDVPLIGEQDFVVDEQALTYIGFALRVYADEQSSIKTVELHPQCQNLRPWFFAGPPLRCPADVALTSYAASQHFERGLMVWVEETDEFYVFYDEPDQQGFQVVHRTVGLELKPGASEDNRIGEDPPTGLYEPVSGFGLVWRGEVEWPYADNVRERLGWATAPESGYDTAHQCSTPAYPRLWNCFLLGPDGEVIHLRPDSTAGVRLLWEEW